MRVNIEATVANAREMEDMRPFGQREDKMEPDLPKIDTTGHDSHYACRGARRSKRSQRAILRHCYLTTTASVGGGVAVSVAALIQQRMWIDVMVIVGCTVAATCIIGIASALVLTQANLSGGFHKKTRNHP